MKSVQAYQCVKCESIYKTSKEASACLKECKSKEKQALVEQKRLDKLDYWRNYPRLNATSIQDIIDMSIEAAKQIDPKSALKSVILNVKYSENVSNSHSSPVKGVSNWCGRDKDQPTGYPGLYGNIIFEYEKYHSSNDIFTAYGKGIVGINTGSGGYNSKGNYGVTIFLDDFPLIKAKIEKELEEKEIYYAAVKESTTLFNEAYPTNEKYQENVLKTKILQEKIAELMRESALIQNDNNEIRNEYWKPYKMALEAVYDALAKEFVYVNPHG